MARSLNILFILLPLILMLSTKAISPLLAILAVALLIFLPHTQRMESLHALREHRPLLLLIGLLLVWPLLSAAWAPEGNETFSVWTRVTLMSLAGAFLFVGISKLTAPAPWVVRGMALVMLFMMGLFALETVAGAPVVTHTIAILGGDAERFMAKSVNRGLCAIAMLIWPILYGLIRSKQRPLAFATFLVTALAVLSLDSISAKIGVVGGALVWLSLTLLPRIGSRILQFALPLFFVLMPVATYWMLYAPDLAVVREWFALYASGRMPIWQSLIENSHAHWVLGWGMATTPLIPYNANLPELIPFFGPPLHPHHSTLQLLLELGAVGFALVSVALALLVRSINCISDVLARNAALTMLAAYLGTGLFSFGIWQNWWVGCAWLVAILWQRFSQKS